MKKIILICALFMCASMDVDAQRIAKNALGIRFNDDDSFNSFGAEITYQRGLMANNRFEFDLGFRGGQGNYNLFRFIGLFQWVMPLEKDFQWYVGAGGGGGNRSWSKKYAPNAKGQTFALVAGDIGIEYNFKIPLLISLDLRPELGVGVDGDGYGEGFNFNLGLGIRYQF